MGWPSACPVADASIVDLVCDLERRPRADDINAAFAEAAASGRYRGVLDVTDRPLVSSDIVGSPRSCTFSVPDTMVQGRHSKVFGWYDNEWGYANRLVDVGRAGRHLTRSGNGCVLRRSTAGTRQRTLHDDRRYVMSDTAGEQESKDARAESVERQLEGDAPPQEPPVNESGGSDPADGTDDVGESTTRSGEDMVDKEGKEAGREDTGTSGPTDRPTGTSTERDVSGI